MNFEWNVIKFKLFGRIIYSSNDHLHISKIFFQMVHHGNKAPEFSYKTDPYKNSFSEENGQLTLVI